MNEKKLRLITEILAIVIVVLVSFVGVYKQNMNKQENQVKDYLLGRDLEGYREILFSVSDATQVLDENGKVVGNTDTYSDDNISSYNYQKTETKINPDEDLTEENYKKAKKIIEKRLEKFGVEDYTLSLDTQNGTMCLMLPDNSYTDHIISNILEVSKFEIKDSEDDSKVFLTNDDIEKAASVYGQDSSGTVVYLQLEFNKNGKNVLKELSTGEYKTKETSNETSTQTNETEDENVVEGETNISTDEASVEENVTEENTSSESSNSEGETEQTEETQKKITLSIDETDLITTSFDDPIENGAINLSMGNASNDVETISSTIESTSTVATLLNNGKMPLTYKITENKYVKTDVTNSIITKSIVVISIIIAVGLILLIVKYKLKGLFADISFVGFIAIHLIIVRYTNVEVSIETMVAEIILLIINYLLTTSLLKINEKDEELKQKAYKNELVNWIRNLIPICLVIIIFVFTNVERLAGFGMFMFWGIFISIIYNYLLTRDMLDE